MNMLIITVAVIVWLMAKLVGRSAERKPWLNEIEKRLLEAERRLDYLERQINTNRQAAHIVAAAVLKDARATSRLQAAIEPIYNHFYRHDFLYHYSYANCARISSDILRAIGWRVPQKGVTGDLKAAGAFAYLSVKDLSFASGQKMVDFLNEEQMRLFPRKAFEAASEDLLAILMGQRNDTNRTLTDYEQALRDDTLAVLFILVPQIPSSRAFGTYPVASFDEYRNRVPADHSKWRIVPVDTRLFPENRKSRFRL